MGVALDRALLVECPGRGAKIMWSWADKMVKAVSDVTVGTVIVLVHVALADRNRRPTQQVVAAQRRITN
jgi:hypothetical protein